MPVLTMKGCCYRIGCFEKPHNFSNLVIPAFIAGTQTFFLYPPAKTSLGPRNTCGGDYD
jgi:hypothetical protein